MTLSRTKRTKRVHSSTVSQKRAAATGLCINCGNRITLCGRPFTAEVRCCKCHHINIFDMSQQPVSCRPMDGDGQYKELS